MGLSETLGASKVVKYADGLVVVLLRTRLHSLFVYKYNNDCVTDFLLL